MNISKISLLLLFLPFLLLGNDNDSIADFKNKPLKEQHLFLESKVDSNYNIEPFIRVFLKNAAQKKDTIYLTKAYYFFYKLSRKEKQLDTAHKHIDTAIKIAKMAKNDSLLGSFYHAKGAIYNAQSEYSNTISYYLKAYDILRVKGATSNRLTLEFDIVSYKLKTKNTQATLDNYKGIIHAFDSLVKKNPNSRLINIRFIKMLLNVGQSYTKKGLYNEAFNSYNKGLKLSNKHDYLFGQYIATGGKGNVLTAQKKYEEAIPYLKAYKGKKRRWNNTDFYQLGYAYYKQKDYENAIKQFNKIVSGSNFVAQNAYYHLGECYLNTDKKQQALNAFRNASQMDFDVKIQEDAGLNYARLSYEIGNPYESVPSVLTSYLKKYPETEHQAELEELLVSSYITSKDYEAALDLLEASKKYSDKATYQKVAFYRAIELFNDGKFQDALSYFEKSLKENEAPEYTARATFWKAETNYLLDNYDIALEGFKSFVNANITDTDEAQTIDYNLAYTYFKQKDYANAVTNFEKFIANNADDKGCLLYTSPSPRD